MVRYFHPACIACGKVGPTMCPSRPPGTGYNHSDCCRPAAAQHGVSCMFWALPLSLQGRSSVSEALFGVLLGGGVLVSLFLGGALVVLALPMRSEGMVTLAWLLQSAYVFLSAAGLWRSAKNARSHGHFVTARVLAVSFALAQAWIVGRLFAPGFSPHHAP